VGGMGTIIGTAPNAVAVGELDGKGMPVSFLNWMMFAVPVAFSLVVISYFLLTMIFLKKNTAIDPELVQSKTVELTPEIVRKRRIVITILLVTILLWLTGSYLEITVASVAAVPLVFLTLTGVVSGKDVRTLPWDTLLLVAGGISLGVALQRTELLSYYTAKIVNLGLSPMIILLILAYLAMLIANFMSATAIATVFIPLAFEILPNLQKEAALIIAMATSTGIFLPVSDIPNSISYSTGFMEQKDYLKTGLLVGLFGPLLIVLWITFIV
jgi:solute carrier family 13 (sodium-dependent dicarboxylate transporter), member 2/3/5